MWGTAGQRGGLLGCRSGNKASKELEAPEFNWGPWGLLYFHLFLVTYRIQSTLHKCSLDTMVKNSIQNRDTSVEGMGFGGGVGGHRGA